MGRLEEALEFVDIQDWVEEYVETKYGGNDEIRVQTCPKCFNDKWKLYVNIEKKTWFCQRCQWGRGMGDLCYLFSAISDKNVHTIRKDLIATVVPALGDDEFVNTALAKMIEEKEKDEFDLDPIDLPGIEGLDGRTGERAKEYLLSRGMTEEDLEYYKIRLSSKLRNNIGPWSVFPVIYYNVPVACQGRKFLNDSEPRYLSSDKIANWMWPLDITNIGNIEELEYVVLVEGVFDALAYIKAGIPALCTFGKNLSRSQIKLLLSHGVKTLYLSYDADAHKDIQNTADRVGHLFHTHIIELIPLPDNPKADPGDVLSGIIPESWLLESFKEAIDTRTAEYWNWKLRKELGE